MSEAYAGGGLDVPKSSDLMGLPVLAGPDLQRIGRVQAVLVSRDGSHLCGLVLDTGGWLQPRRVLDFQAVRSVSATHLVADERYLTDESGTACGDRLFGLPVLDAGGEELGAMDDMYFDPTSGRVIALQLSRGFVDDLVSGKGVVAVSGPLLAGEAAIMLGGGTEAAGGVEE